MILDLEPQRQRVELLTDEWRELVALAHYAEDKTLSTYQMNLLLKVENQLRAQGVTL